MPTIQVDHVSKRFDLQPDRPRSFQELILSGFGRQRRARKEEFWALRDVSLCVESGETLGIIGANGSGKSTCLKLLTRIIEPTSGLVTVNGRVAALLELGAGFHPDLTGRDNILLNGAILGLRRREMEQRMDEIVAFAELERFIDVPVKFYSSGMYVRLAFATAVHVNPDVLLIDEVLAVGDYSFQAKCLDHISTLKRRGTTIVFVSHNLDEVRQLCDRAVWLQNGVVCADGPAEEVVSLYVGHASGQPTSTVTQAVVPSAPPDRASAMMSGSAAGGVPEDTDERAVVDPPGPSRPARFRRRWGTREAEIERVWFENGQQQIAPALISGKPASIVVAYRAPERISEPVFGIAIHRSDGLHVSGTNTALAKYRIPYIHGEGQVRYSIAFLPLPPGTYYVTVAIHDVTVTRFYDYQEWMFEMVVQGDAVCDGFVHLPATWGHTLASDARVTALP